MSLLTRSSSVKRGPYKKRDGESAVPAPRSVADIAPPGMLNELQRTVPKSRMSRVSSMSEPPSTSASVSQMDQSATAAAVPLYIQSIPSARPSEGPFPYSTSVMIPAQTPQASMPPSSSHASLHHHRGEDQYYQPRYDHLAHGSARSEHYRIESYVDQPEYQVKPVVEHRAIRPLQYQSPEDSPRERQYSGQMYNDTRMIQASPVHHDVSYPSQSDPGYESPSMRSIDYSYAGQQHQRSYERTYQERSYAGDGHIADTQQEIQQPQQYQPYNSYQPSSSYASHSYGYPQNHVPHAMAPTQHVSEQSDSGYLNRTTPDQVSYGSSINSYPAQQPYPQQSMSSAHYTMRAAGRVMPRDMVAHQHVGNVQIPSN
jgi:hypothetical protein